MAHAKNTKTFSTLARLTGAAGIVAATLLGVAPAQAHDELLSSNPSADAALTEAPAELELTYSGDIMDVAGANQVRVTNAAGDALAEGEPEVDGKVITQALTSAQTTDDTYTVTWRVVSSDGHPIQGTFTYTVGEGAGSSASASTVAEPTGDSAKTESSATTDPVAEATDGMSTGAKVTLFALAAAALLGGLFVVLAKTKKRD